MPLIPWQIEKLPCEASIKTCFAAEACGRGFFIFAENAYRLVSPILICAKG